RVMVAGQVKPAQVLALEKSGQRITVLLEGNLRVTLSPERILRHLPGPAPVTAVKISRAAGDLAEDQPGKACLGAAGVGRVLNLVGKRVEEAAELLPSFIDQAVLAGETQVEIIHGHGTGRLRQGVWEILLGLPWVGKCFHPEAAAGGAAITVVELKG
ncbi:MAG: Smr/MutS family protein, partial [Deltaproteobacteria bacterium]|nr:Smr/MutS family protein [Deltaproteobacteria bacterium]